MGLRGSLGRLARVIGRALGETFDQSLPIGRLALLHGLQAAGTTLVTVSLAGTLFFSISPDEAKGRVLLYLLLTIAPFALVGPALSPLLDRGRQARRTSAAVATGGSALLSLAMARNVHQLLLFPEAFGVLVLGKLYLVARAALVPAMLEVGDDLASANARLAVVASLSGFAAFPVGVAVFKLSSAAWVLRIAALVFLVGMGAAFRLPRREPPATLRRAEEPSAGAPLPQGGADAPRGAPGATGVPSGAERHQKQRASRVRSAVNAMTVARASVGFVAFFLAFALRRAEASTWWFGLLLAVSGAGALLGSIVVPRLRRFLAPHQIIEAALAMMAVGALGAAVTGGLWAQAMLTFVVGIGPMSAKAACDSIVQGNVKPSLLGRTFGRIETRLQLAWVLAALLGVVVPFPLRLGDLVVSLACGAAAAASLAASRLRRTMVDAGS